MKRPSMQFYPGDWLHDAALRICSALARSLWIDMLCLMHQGEPYGHLKVNQKVILPHNLARISGLTPQEADGCLEELVSAGVVSVADDGTMYSRRMVRDEALRQVRASAGKLGGNPALIAGRKVIPRISSKVKQKTTPSSSASASASEDQELLDHGPTNLSRSEQKSGSGGKGRAPKAPARARATPTPQRPPDVSEQTWLDWLALRRSKRAPVTATVIAGSFDEAQKAGMTLDAFLREWCTRGSQGLKAEWIKSSGQNGRPTHPADSPTFVADCVAAGERFSEYISRQENPDEKH